MSCRTGGFTLVTVRVARQRGEFVGQGVEVAGAAAGFGARGISQNSVLRDRLRIHGPGDHLIRTLRLNETLLGGEPARNEARIRGS